MNGVACLKTYKSKAMSCIGMKDLGCEWLAVCREMFYFVKNNGWTCFVPGVL